MVSISLSNQTILIEKKSNTISDIWIKLEATVTKSYLAMIFHSQINALKINTKSRTIYININTVPTLSIKKRQRKNIPINFSQLKKDLAKNNYVFNEIDTGTEYVVFDHTYPEMQGFRTKIGNPASKDIALFEYIERICSLSSPKNIFVESYNNLSLKYDVIHPNHLGYHWANNDLLNFSNDMDSEWVISHSLYSNEKKLTPLQFSHYNTNIITTRFIEGNSNGCALGTSLSEACLFGLLEFIERDTFIGYWYFNEFGITEVNSSGVKYIEQYRAYMGAKGYNLQFFYLKNITGLYTIWCLARNKKNAGIYSVSGLACKFSLKEAIKSSFEEACGVLHAREKEKYLNEKIKEVENVSNIEEISTIDSIIYYYSSEKMVKEKLELDLLNVKKINYENLKQSSLYSDSIEGDLKKLLSVVKKRYSDVIYADLTPGFLTDYNFFCVKVTGLQGYDMQFKIDKEHRPVNNNRSPILPIA